MNTSASISDRVPGEQHRLLPEPGLQWLLRLRWVAAGGQFLTCLVVDLMLRARPPWIPLLAGIGVTVGTNLLAHRFGPSLRRRADAACALLLALDTLTLSWMLWWTGGASNPFTGFYLLHLAVASMLLPLRWTALFLLVSSGAFGIQFLSPHEFTPPGLATFGRLVSFVMVGASIAFFVGRLRLALLDREQELFSARDRTHRNERFASVATLAAGVAHELATPLSTIAVVSADFERLALTEDGKDDIVRDARLIRTEVDRCRSVLEGLSHRATSGIGDPPERIELFRIADLLRPYLARGIEDRITFDLPEAPLTIAAPLPPLLQSLAALCKNACEASADSEPVELRIREENGRVRFSVIDRGFGMDPDFARRIGEPFLTTKPPGKGMGLGVFLVRTFAERVDGALEVSSLKGSGTTIDLLIPVSPEHFA